MVRLVIAVRAIPCFEKLICCTSVMGTAGVLGVLAHPGSANAAPNSPSSEVKSAIFHFLWIHRFIESDLSCYGVTVIRPASQ